MLIPSLASGLPDHDRRSRRIGLATPHLQATQQAATDLDLAEMLVRYHDSGYEADLAKVGERALRHLQHIGAGRKAGERWAMVLDIDETSLANDWPLLEASVRDPVSGYDAKAWNTWINQADAPPIAPTLDLFKAAREMDIEVFFISGRHPDEKDVTERTLKKAGYDGWTELIGEPRQGDNPRLLVFPEAAAFKTAARWSITERGYRIVLNMGDQLSDLQGGFADATFKLPNPFYTIV